MDDEPDSSLKELKINNTELLLYRAGQYFEGNFTRDGIISAILMQDAEMLRNQLVFSGRYIGRNKNSFTGEEPGKIFHEYPGVKLNGLSTKFNACDTTALFLIGHEIYQRITGDKSLAGFQAKKIIDAVDYISRHIKDGAFIEDPEFCGNGRFALKVTDWKDSELPGRENGEPFYPVIYTLAHIQNMRALKSAAVLLNNKCLEQKVSEMRKFLGRLFDEEREIFYIAVDNQGPISIVSSDMLHALFYLDREDISREHLEKIVESSGILETSFGYRTLSEEESKKISDGYHARNLWPFEQSLIHIGAKKFDLKNTERISSRIKDYFDENPDENPETLLIDNNEIKKTNGNPQFWTIAARHYFRNNQNGIFP